MVLTDRQAAQLADVLRTLAEPYGEHEIRARLGAQLLALLDAQF